MAYILLVDDDPENRILIKLILESGKHSVVLTATGGQGLQLALEKRPDLLLLDAMLPDMDGYEICRALRARPELAGLPILFFSARIDDRAQARALEAGATGFIPKSLSPKELLRRIADELAKAYPNDG